MAEVVEIEKVAEVEKVVEEAETMADAAASLPGNCAFAALNRSFRPPKLAETCKAPGSGSRSAEIRLVSYNVLADAYAKSVGGVFGLESGGSIGLERTEQNGIGSDRIAWTRTSGLCVSCICIDSLLSFFTW